MSISAASAVEHQRRKRLKLWMDAAALGANALGAGLVSLFYYLQGGNMLRYIAEYNAMLLVILQLFLPVLLILGTVISSQIEKPLTQWYLHPDPLSQPSAPPAAQRLMLEVPLRSALISIAMWLLSGLGLSALNLAGLGFDADWQQLLLLDWSMPLAMMGVAAPLTAVLVYFLTEAIYGRELPLFFPQQNLADFHVFRVTIRWRLLLPVALGWILMAVLALTAYTQAAQIAVAADPQAALARLGKLVAFLLFLGLLSAGVLIFSLGTPMARSIEALRRRMLQVRQGELEGRIEVRSNDEFGDLASGFNAMVAGLRQEEVIRRLFSLYVTPEVAQHAILHGADLGGQLTEATVLFSDVRGFTTLAEQLAPETMIALLNRYFQAMSAEVTAHGGLVNKFGGDSLLAVFGAPIHPVADHAGQAVWAGQAMLAALERFNAEQLARGEPALQIGIGIASGPVVAGNVGSQQRLEYTVIGDTVNLASRLQSMTKELGAPLLLSASTMCLLPPGFALQSLGQVEVRGRQQTVEIFRLPG